MLRIFNSQNKLRAELFDVTFTVTDGSTPVENARIVLGGEEKFTNALGVAVFQLIADTFTYEITHASYDTVTDTVTVTGDQAVAVDIFTKLSPYNLDVPEGWLVPTEAEWEVERLSWSSNNRNGAFGSTLKLSVTGWRYFSDGLLEEVGVNGGYWSSTVDVKRSMYLYFSSGDAFMDDAFRAFGESIRLIKQEGLPLVSGNQTFTYNGASWTYREVESNGRIWMDRNLGASQVASAFNDSAAYGDLFQWGRNIDGHQVRTSGTTTTLSNSDTPGHGNFIRVSLNPVDWRSPQNDNLWQPI